MKSSTKKLLIGLIEPLLKTFGSTQSLVEVPALMVRRFVILAVAAVGALLLLIAGLSLLLSGLMEIAAALGATWIVSIVVGSLVAVAGASGLVLSLRREIWTRPVEETRPASPHPLETVLQMAIELLEERRAQRRSEAASGPVHSRNEDDSNWNYN
ncbi:MAG TPA: hypothetical protein PL182_12725 [Pseudobdellovibrionaceae bacterium]|nr:hypothetical protein [Pseudobdellovibrionaceae bacterium]